MGNAVLSDAYGSVGMLDRLPRLRNDAVRPEAPIAAPAAMPRTSTIPVLIISAATLIRDCLARCLADSELNCTMNGYTSVDEWRPADPTASVTVLLCATGDGATERAICDDIAKLQAKVPDCQIIVLSDTENPALVRRTLEQGAHGFVGMTFNLDMAAAAIRLVQAGERFVPVSSLLAAQAAPMPAADKGPFRQILTQRQIDVIDRLRRGESNKIIAHKLEMSESTVKIHIRNVMRKIKARNRTEVAILTKDLFD
ncbi:response regulator transcription factor [Labrys sp. KNU-23]|uniref:response regulator transcription factor n=1 Tax=Labrys sp. KNU-23 TaxID=2789216 RepID=UPI00165C7EE2|nr:response regulator transcription factor [Labrys sp. KNU-23]